MDELKIKKLLYKKFKTPYIPVLPDVLFSLNRTNPKAIIGIIDQRYKQSELIEYIMHKACMHHNTLPLKEYIVKRYVLEYFYSKRKWTYNEG